MIYFNYQVGDVGIGMWVPQIIKAMSSGLSNFQVGLIAMIPSAFATVAMVLLSKESDRTGERQKRAAVPLPVGGLALAGGRRLWRPVRAQRLAVRLHSYDMAGAHERRAGGGA